MPPKTTPKKAVPLKLPPDLVGRLDSAAKVRGISRNAYVEGAIRAALGEGKAATAAPPARPTAMAQTAPRYTCPEHGGYHVGKRCTVAPGCTKPQRKVG